MTGSLHPPSGLLRRLTLVARGEPLSANYRLFFQDGNKPVSPWHDIPLFSESGHVHMVTEISMGIRAKFEISTHEEHNPIRQDLNKKGEPRFYVPQPFFNYGAAPQTWEDPAAETKQEPGLRGDGDPLDIVEIGETPMPAGGVAEVKILGAFCLIDQGEVDWKLLALSTDRAESQQFACISELPQERVQKVVDWFRTYKTFEGKEENRIGCGGRILTRKEALEVIDECHHHWRKLRSVRKQEQLSGESGASD